MKKTISIVIALIICISISYANKTYTAKKVMSIAFSMEDGTNASSVVWNADKQIYYSVIAGNGDYPLETFSQSGENLFSDAAGIDVRGLWYNPKSKKLEGNCAGENGLFTIKIEATGKPGENQIVIKGQNQPGFNSVGAFNSKKQIIYYYQEGEIFTYKAKSGKASKSFKIKNCPTEIENLNSTTVIYTGLKDGELGLLDINNPKVYLFDLKGNFTATVELPSDAITNDVFRFSFANGKIWLYDVDSRSWTGYTFL